MPTTRKTFHRGIMDKDTDERLLPDGVVRHAENVLISHSEGSDEGSVENMLSNKLLTNLHLGSNIETIGKFSDKAKNKLYWFVVSDEGCYLIEYDVETQSSSFVLKDTRVVGERVLDLRKDKYITGIVKIINEVDEKDMFLWTDNNIDVCCINIERAKTYGENGFEKEDIFLIKKPPFYAPKTQFILSETLSNNIEERFFAFAYRYKYIDGEYSALSSFSNYKFSPKQFQMDYDTLENLSMVNTYNSVRISFDTGDKRVTDIQIIAKSSNSNNLYIIETFNKEKEGWVDSTFGGNTVTKDINFSNNKLYALLPEKELYRFFDNVPRKAKALTTIGNRIVLGNYLEGYNLQDNNLDKIKIQITPFINTYKLDSYSEITFQSVTNGIALTNENDIELKEGFKLIFDIYIIRTSNEQLVFSDSFEYILNRDYDNFTNLWEDPDFQSFFEVINFNFQAGYQIEVPEGWEILTEPEITLSSHLGYPTINLSNAIYKDTYNDDEVQLVPLLIHPAQTEISISEIATSTSLHSNRDIEVVMIYIDGFGRQTIGLSSKNNTVHIPQKNSVTQNKLGLRIDHKPPYWAVAYKIGVKTAPLTYQTIYVSKYYNENTFVWCKLEGDNKDKVKEGDVLILKRTANAHSESIIKTKVLEIKTHEKDFLKDNVDSEGLEIEEEAGTYMKIKPTGFNMSYDDFSIYQDNTIASRKGSGNHPIGYVSLFTQKDEEGSITGELPIPSGTSIYLWLKSDHHPKSGTKENIYEATHYANRDYDDLEEWFTENILNRPLYGNKGNSTDDYNGNIEIIRGFKSVTFGLTTINPDPEGELWLKVRGTKAGMSGGRYGYINIKIIVRTIEGIFVFETEPSKETDLNIFYQSEETFWIKDGNHKAVTTDLPLSNTSDNDQNVAVFKPAEIELSFYNCFSFGNGVESYKIKDAFNSNFLNIDLKPTTTSVEEYKEVRRYADVTYGEPYVESSNINGLNEFNASTANWKELEKEHGAIQILKEREGNLLVVQTNKWGQVLFGKDAMYNTDGTSNVSKVPYVLGEFIPYQGEYGISDPESFANEANRYYAVDKERGVVLRLSENGLIPIVQGMKDWFRDIFHKNNRAKIIGGIDPYHKLYQITIGDQPYRILELQCDNVITKYNQSEPFEYNLKLNNLGGDITISYDISQGNATITAEFDENTYVASNVTGQGNLTFQRTSLVENTVKVTITPVSEVVSYTIGNVCPVGTELKIVSIILNDESDLGFTMTNRFRWGSSSFYENNDLFDDVPCSRFQIETGLEGVGKFPTNGALVNMQTIKDSVSSGEFKITDCNKLAYLITDSVYDESDIETILNNANYLTLSTIGQGGGEEQGDTTQGTFVFNRPVGNEILYMIWDYTDRSPVLNDDSENCQVGQSVTIDVLANDEIQAGATVSIITPPQHGTYVINPDQTITYTHNGTDNFEDSFVYQVNQNGCLASATVTISIGVPCSNGINASGNIGIYEAFISVGTETGLTGIIYNAQNVPDRFLIYWNNELVADSKYVGDGLNTTPPVSYPGLLGEKTLSVYQYNGTNFVDTETTETIDVIQDDIADNETEATDGNGTLLFNKTTPTPTTIKIVVIGAVGGTAWTLQGVCPINEEDLVNGNEILLYGFFNEANKGNTTKSMMFVFDSDNNKFYTNIKGDQNFTTFGFNSTTGLKYINNGTTWWEIDATGEVVNSGSL